MVIEAPEATEEAKTDVRAVLTRDRLEDYLRRRADWAHRMRALFDEEAALDQLERELLEALAPGAETRSGERDGTKGDGSFSDVVHAFERRLIEQALAACHGVQRDAAALLRISPTTLNEKLKRLGIHAGRHHG